MWQWIDSRLLACAEKTAHAYNWLTGKDNFDLAHKVNWFMAGSVSAACVFGVLEDQMYKVGWILCCLIIPIGYWLQKNYIQKIERKRAQEQEAGIKSIELKVELENQCTGLVFISFPIWAFFSLTTILRFGFYIFATFSVIGGLELFLGILCINYLLRVEKPPYARSQVRDWIHSLFAKPAPVVSYAKSPVPA